MPSSPYGPCSSGSTTSTSSAPTAGATSPSTGNALGSAAGPAAIARCAESASNQRPSVVIATGTTS